eukprot:5102948-Pyramimonas_sp.AAC.2
MCEPEAQNLQQLRGWRAGPFHNVALAVSPRAFVSKVFNGFKDGGRFATASRMKAGPFSKCGCRRSAAHIRPKSLQQSQGWREGPFSKCGCRRSAAHNHLKSSQQLQGWRAGP